MPTTMLLILPVAVLLIIMLVVAMLMTSLWNWAIERVAYRPLRGSFRLAPLITAIIDTPAKRWTTDSMAEFVHMSRARFCKPCQRTSTWFGG